jgi:hypothetical protein
VGCGTQSCPPSRAQCGGDLKRARHAKPGVSCRLAALQLYAPTVALKTWPENHVPEMVLLLRSQQPASFCFSGRLVISPAASHLGRKTCRKVNWLNWRHWGAPHPVLPYYSVRFPQVQFRALWRRSLQTSVLCRKAWASQRRRGRAMLYLLPH